MQVVEFWEAFRPKRSHPQINCYVHSFKSNSTPCAIMCKVMRLQWYKDIDWQFTNLIWQNQC